MLFCYFTKATLYRLSHSSKYLIPHEYIKYLMFCQLFLNGKNIRVKKWLDAGVIDLQWVTYIEHQPLFITHNM